MSKKSKDKDRKLAPYFCHGVDLSRREGKNHLGDCPFCGKEQHFSVDPGTGMYICAVCGERGNTVTFLEKMMEEYRKQVTPEDLRNLAKHRELPVEALRLLDLGYDGNEWMIAVRSKTGRVHDIRRYDPAKKLMRSTAGCSPELCGMEELVKAKKGSVVHIVEGEWDKCALMYLLKRAGRAHEPVGGLPGANLFKKAWVEDGVFSGQDVRLLLDNDQAGDDGAERSAELLRGVPKKLQFLCWPESRPNGWDVRDHTKAGLKARVHPLGILESLESLLRPEHRRANSGAEGGKDTVVGEATAYADEVPVAKCPSFKDVLKAFTYWLEMDEDNTMALAISLAVCLSAKAPGEPLWVHLVGPPGSGKTVILNQFQKSPKVVFRSTLTPHGLVSGFKTEPDPSLLPKFHLLTAIFKDFTEVLAFHPTAKDETFGTFRGAYDGYVQKDFGNGVQRHYKVKFNLLTGVTPAIHADNKATMGERFLKFNMMPTQKDADKVIFSAIENALADTEEESQMEKELQDLIARFLQRKVDFKALPTVAHEYKARIVALAQICGMLRATVDREAFGEKEIKYRPQYEVGTRVAKQLIKAMQFIAFVFDLKAVNDDVYRIVERLAMDSCIGLHVEVVEAIMERGGKAIQGEVRDRIGLPETNVGRKFNDLSALGILRKAGTVKMGPNGTATTVYELAPKVATLWRLARPGQSVIERAVASRKTRQRPKAV
jgi:hypothetical protein